MTSHAYTEDQLVEQPAIRLSWCHMTNEPDWENVISSIRSLK
jgi:hypothetical protein